MAQGSQEGEVNDLEYAACRKCGDEVLVRDLSESGLCIECMYEMNKIMQDPQEMTDE